MAQICAAAKQVTVWIEALVVEARGVPAQRNIRYRDKRRARRRGRLHTSFQ